MRKKNRGTVWAVLLLAMVLIGVALYYFWGEQQKSSAKSAPPSAVVTRGDVESIVSATGTIQPRDYVDVGAQVSGQLRKIHVKVGDHVNEGDLLAEIDVTVYKARVDASRAQLKYQKAQLIDREAQLTLSELNYKRQKGLYGSDATSLEALQNAETSLKSSKAQLEMIRAQIEQLESSIRADEANLAYTRIYAPMTGTIVSITARQGQTLNTNQQAPTILRIADLSIMTIKAQVSEADVNRLKRGMSVYFTTLGSDKRYTSNLNKIEPTPTITNNVVLYSALFDVENTDGHLMSDMTTQVFFIVSSAKNTLLVPISALTLSKNQHTEAKLKETKETNTSKESNSPRIQNGAKTQKGVVQILKDNGITEERSVEVGVTSRLQAQILSGLNEGEKVILRGVKPSTTSSQRPSGVPAPRMF